MQLEIINAKTTTKMEVENCANRKMQTIKSTILTILSFNCGNIVSFKLYKKLVFTTVKPINGKTKAEEIIK